MKLKYCGGSSILFSQINLKILKIVEAIKNILIVVINYLKIVICFNINNNLLHLKKNLLKMLLLILNKINNKSKKFKK